MDKIRSFLQRMLAWARRHRTGLIIASSIIVPFILFHFWLHITNPYASLSIVQQPYVTEVAKNGDITYHKQFDMAVFSGGAAQALGYYKSGFLILQNTYFGSRPAASSTAEDIIGDIHKLRFDPSKPYLISGDQFSVLYPRNLGVFYNSLLDPRTAHDEKDWQNRQRIYLQSLLYALDAFSREKTLTTTIVPVGPRTAVLTEVHPGSVPSDTLYGMFYALHALQDETRYPNPLHKLSTVQAARHITEERKDDLATLLSVYLNQVQDPATGFVKRSIDLASARDGVVRDSSLYDNIVLWKTLDLADRLEIKKAGPGALEKMRKDILNSYWDTAGGHFKDDLAAHVTADANYSSDWLIALPAGFLSPQNPDDLPYLEQSVAFIRSQKLAEPFPIKYQLSTSAKEVPWAVRTFVPNYGGDSIWSYWGAQYITLLGDLHHQTKSTRYLQEANQAIDIYKQKIVQNRGFPETFTPTGDFLQNAIYKSIRQTGWVVQFEQAQYVVDQEKTTTE